jgi:hypothetical protein|nr:DUF4105 domain-containing protein [Candidatus Krumholzibacteria bacterium]
MRRKNLLVAAGVLVCLFLLSSLAVALKEPRDDRNWKPEHSRVPVVTLTNDMATVQNVRNFRVAPDGSDLPAFDTRTFDLSRLESLWYVLAIFHEGDFRGPAHSMFSFGFSDSSFVAISVEARKEVGEGYSIWQGLLNKYEMIYVVGDEKDLVLTRAAYRADNVYLYPVAATPEKIRELFVEMLQEAAELKTHPEFYNTLTNNCTTRLRDHVNQVEPGLIPMSWKVQLPGYSDQLIQDLGLLEGKGSLIEARHRYWINDRARRDASDPDFSRLIRSDAR